MFVVVDSSVAPAVSPSIHIKICHWRYLAGGFWNLPRGAVEDVRRGIERALNCVSLQGKENTIYIS
jgi:hypothetical protein